MLDRIVRPPNRPVRGFAWSLRGWSLCALSLLGASCATSNDALEVVSPAAARRSIELRSSQEVRTGRCSDAHERELQATLSKMIEAFATRSDRAGFKRVGSAIVVARESGTTFSLDAGLGGEYHVFAIGYSPVTLAAEDDSGNVTDTPSNRAHIANVTGEIPASLELADAKGDYLITLKGKGCALVATFKRIY